MASGSVTADVTSGGGAVRGTAVLVSATFVLVGVLGFVPGVTTHVGDIAFAGHRSGAHLLGVFQVSVLHNLLHLLLGLAGLMLARTAAGARLFLVGGGAMYLVLWLYGLAVVGHSATADVIPVNSSDNWLHLGLGLGMIALGLVLVRPTSTTAR
jgi:hypothetical protein